MVQAYSTMNRFLARFLEHVIKLLDLSIMYFTILYSSTSLCCYMKWFNIFQALRDLDFEIRDKLFVESVFDIEFQDPSITDKAVFYTGTNVNICFKYSNLKKRVALIGLNDLSIFHTSRYRTFFWRSSFIWTWVFSNYFWRLDVFVCRSIGSRLLGSSYCNIFCRKGMFLKLNRIKICIMFLEFKSYLTN